MLYRVHLAKVGLELTTLVVIDTDCIGSYKSNYHTITTGPSILVNILENSQTYFFKIPSNPTFLVTMH